MVLFFATLLLDYECKLILIVAAELPCRIVYVYIQYGIKKIVLLISNCLDNQISHKGSIPLTDFAVYFNLTRFHIANSTILNGHIVLVIFFR